MYRHFRPTSLILIALVFCCTIFLLSVPVKGESCMKSFKNFKDIEDIMKKCTEKLNLKPEDVKKIMSWDELAKNGYDDKCYFKCNMDEMKMLKPDGTFDLAKIEENLKTNAPADKVDALMKIFKTCVDTTSKDPMSKEPCKATAMTKACVLKEEKEVC